MIFDPSDRAELLAVFRDEADELVQAIDSDLLRLDSMAEEGAIDRGCIDSLFRALHTIKGSAAMLELHAASALAHRLESACDLLRKRSLSLSKPVVEALFEGRDLLTALIRSGTEGTPGPPDSAREAFLGRLDAVVQPPSEGAIAPASPEPASQPQSDVASTRGRGRTIRVDIARLDVLLDLVGELVIAKNRVLQIAARREGPSGDLEVAAAQLARLTADLQEAVMRARMVRIAGVFERFPRLVHDLAKTQGKDIQLVVDGADTDLDKTIVDEIGEPLMHLLRNCVDHGIESPKRRRESGKAPAGVIHLRAYHDENAVVIEVGDDGGGIDLSRVRERGLELGLIDEGAHDERDLLELLFAPGFSTARAVTELSGRGVGMDVVRRAVAAMSGTLEVTTRPGSGTTFTIRLPLTLAIVRAMLVRIAESTYALPVGSVGESLRLEPGEVRGGRTGETILHRDRELPLIRGAEYFELGGVPAGSGKVLIVIVNAGNREVGLIVDEFVGEQEIVVKPLTDLIGAVPGISGGTILGDGTIALIVDPVALVNQAHRVTGSLLLPGSV